MFFLGEGGTVDVRIDHGKVVGWKKIFLEVRGGISASVGRGISGKRERGGLP